ncbi:50S ribosomal protein L23 [Candidatus Berkelbacteria bacterium RIFCSPLOWO2_01_FULL_50_28]|uniref:50S ribosomal protein L23 n=1 Tax=Candidatus Berkelbacteria bacterium RIFCSPLOWO2_01_FULL_50_28 TaxID=1797471 RepID=A0A1F5EC05_9BACT|nr:MAG: 50S ribosomal protein L23 [Candidatus Berkelbacteria bacterium RIFCSPHIGHO2_01_FULL_50_36]OGD62272.1 MAG: 50S ribosomal protein L23 [Candidatus Berkelbacteria bacterium RIFCSPHIGHO2_12_FULL_50_11]OGD64915.1 MAG: 50S ribosomal protein L23 [Candidatus Berkelbacteria bacterium RIFCSPLOWO2_01_FULL_50_28]
MAIIKPLLTEKSATFTGSGLYVFQIEPGTSKPSIKSQLKQLFNVDATSVRVVNLPAKKVSFKRHIGTRARRSHAYVQLASKQHLPGFELPKPKEEKKESK